MLAIGRSLMAKPKLLLLDEPSMGLSPLMIIEIANIVREINRGGITIFLVEQNARLALKLAQRGYVLSDGRIFLEGNTADLEKSDYIKEAYLGGKLIGYRKEQI